MYVAYSMPASYAHALEQCAAPRPTLPLLFQETLL